MKPLAHLYRRREEILSQMSEIDTRETSANRNFLECDEYRTLDTELKALNGQIEVSEALEADRQRRSGLTEENRQRAGASGTGFAGQQQQQQTEQPRPFRSFGDQLQAIIRSSTPGNALDPRLAELRATGMNEGVGQDGGFLVQTDISTEIWRRAYASGQVLSRCRRIQISANSNGIRLPYIKETSRVAGSRLGGIQVYRRAEAATVTATRPKFGEQRLELESCMALIYLTDELIQDTTALESYVSNLVQEEIVVFAEDEIINGNGIGKPLGITQAGATITVPKETSPAQAAKTIVPQNIVNMDSRIWAASLPNSVWFINQDVKPQLYLMVLATGASSGVPVYMPANGLSGVPYGTLMGRPVIPIEHCSTLGTVGDIISADLSQYLLIEKGPVQQASSIHVQFLYGEQVLRFMWRSNGGPYGGWNEGALTPAKGTATQSPFVVLATR